MSDIKIDDIPPVPFFAHFLEGQFSKDLTQEEMKAVRGGSAVTMAAPSDQEGTEFFKLPDIQEMIRRASEGYGPFPGTPVPPKTTMAYPSDGEVVPV